MSAAGTGSAVPLHDPIESGTGTSTAFGPLFFGAIEREADSNTFQCGSPALCIHPPFFAYTIAKKGGYFMKKQEEPKPISWEVADPKLPVVRSGHMENHRENERA